MFQFAGVPLMHLLIQCMIHGSSPCVFPHSEICGSMLICSSPQLIAACHVLLRLLMPRHSPYALIRLNFLFSFEISVLLNCLSFSKHLGLHIALKRFSFFMLYLIHLSVNLSPHGEPFTSRWNVVFVTLIGKTNFISLTWLRWSRLFETLLANLVKI